MQATRNGLFSRSALRTARCWGLVALLCAAPAWAVDGEFEVRSGGSRLSDGVHYVDARIDYRLSDKALEALDNGVVLTMQLQIEVIRKRAFLPDALIAELKQDSTLSYEPLTQRYVVRNLNSGQQASYATLFSALSSLGRVNGLPVIDAALLDPDAQHRMRLRVVLDQDTLPGPLRLIAFWSSGFRLASDWYGWTIRD
ncbi:MAG: DUF4390 domain-containing protein [Chromatiales bacterium]|nr:MAG: DUF4390 domain-containing protein [Chromatiales bacterium]